MIPSYSSVYLCLSVAEKWQAVYSVLEAFGNASTCMNGNASRFSHIVSLDFDQAGLVTSASIQVQINTVGQWCSTGVSHPYACLLSSQTVIITKLQDALLVHSS